MPTTPIFGFPFEDADDQPGHSLTGGSVGTELILAEEVETALQGIATDVGNVEDRTTAIEARLDLLEAGTSMPGWTPIQSGTNTGASFTIDLNDGGRFPDAAFELYRLHMRFDLNGTANVRLNINNNSTAIYRSGLVNYEAAGAIGGAPFWIANGGGWRIGRAATVSTNNLIFEMFAVTGSGLLNFQSTSTRQSGTDANTHQWIEAWGSLTSTLTPTSMQLQVIQDEAGDTGTSFSNAWWFVEGFRPSV